jgi:hypothetical protein
MRNWFLEDQPLLTDLHPKMTRRLRRRVAENCMLVEPEVSGRYYSIATAPNDESRVRSALFAAGTRLVLLPRWCRLYY